MFEAPFDVTDASSTMPETQGPARHARGCRAACVWLASDEAAWVTGQTITIDGGSVTT